jgi:Zn-dependent protease/CBS domain-containing protein
LNRQAIPLGRIFGIPLRIDLSWFLIFALMMWSLAVGYFPKEFNHWSVAAYWINGAITAFLFFVSVLLHELAHSLVALHYKIPVRSITLYIFGGASEITTEPSSPLSDFWITLSGPIVTFMLAGIFALLAQIFMGYDLVYAPLKYLAYINLLLGLFNMIPGYPLDGGTVLMSIIWGVTHSRHWAVLVSASIGSFFAYVFILYGVYQVMRGGLMNGLWIAFIGWFILNASGTQVRRERLKGVLSDHKVSEAMSYGYTIVHSGTFLQYLVDEHIISGGRRFFIIKQDEQMLGLLTLHDLYEVPREKWPTTTVNEVMVPTPDLKQIGPDTGIWHAIEAMDRNGVNQLPVMKDGQIQGVLTREDVISFLRKPRPV